MNLGLKNKNVLVTGSTKGLGRAIAEVLALEGANVVISGRDKTEAVAVAEHLRKKYGVESMAIPADLSKAGIAEQLYEESISAMGTLDILVNNAAIWPSSYVKDMEKEEFERTLYLNLEVPYILSKLIVNHFLEKKKRGKIVNIVSQAAFRGSTTGHAHYAAAKAGLVTFMISLAKEVAKNGININAVAPGMMNTPMVQENLKKNSDYYNSRIPIGRVAEPEEVASVVAFLASSKADYMTGSTIDVTGGMLMR